MNNKDLKILDNSDISNKIGGVKNNLTKAESLVEQLPKTVEYDGVIYQLSIYINAWNKFVIAYKESSPKGDRLLPRQILSYVVEPGKDPKVAENFGPEDKTYINDSIGNDTTLAKCVGHIMYKLEQHKDVIKIKK